MEGKLAASLRKLQVPWGVLTATLHQHNWGSYNVRTAKDSVQERMKSTIWNNIDTLFDQVQQTTEGIHLNVERDISSLETALKQDTWSI